MSMLCDGISCNDDSCDWELSKLPVEVEIHEMSSCRGLPLWTGHLSLALLNENLSKDDLDDKEPLLHPLGVGDSKTVILIMISKSRNNSNIGGRSSWFVSTQANANAKRDSTPSRGYSPMHGSIKSQMVFATTASCTWIRVHTSWRRYKSSLVIHPSRGHLQQLFCNLFLSM